MSSLYLFDTHALIFWSLKKGISDRFADFFDEQADKGNAILVTKDEIIRQYAVEVFWI